MKVKLLKVARIRHNAGEIVEVNPEEYRFLRGVGAAVPVVETKETPKKGNKKNKAPMIAPAPSLEIAKSTIIKNASSNQRMTNKTMET